MERNSFIFYRSFYEAISDLPDEKQLEIYKAIAFYSFEFKEPELSGVSKSFWKLIRPNLEANNKRFENGKRPKNKQNRSKTEAKQKQNRSKVEADKDVDKDEDIDVEEDIKLDFQKSELKKEDTDTQTGVAVAKPKFDFRKALLSLGANKLHVDEWMTIRNKKKAVNSEYAFATFLKELEKSGQHIDEVLMICSQKQWRGFEASWITEQTNKNKKDDFRKMAAGIIAATNERERNREERERIAKQQLISGQNY